MQNAGSLFATGVFYIEVQFCQFIAPKRGNSPNETTLCSRMQ